MSKAFIKSLDGKFELQLNPGITFFGRSEAGKEYLSKKILVARIHIQLFVENGEVYVEDMGALNGTYVNGEQIVQGARVLVKDTDIIGLGSNDESQEKAAFFKVEWKDNCEIYNFGCSWL